MATVGDELPTFGRFQFVGLRGTVETPRCCRCGCWQTGPSPGDETGGLPSVLKTICAVPGLNLILRFLVMRRVWRCRGRSPNPTLSAISLASLARWRSGGLQASPDERLRSNRTCIVLDPKVQSRRARAFNTLSMSHGTRPSGLSLKSRAGRSPTKSGSVRSSRRPADRAVGRCHGNASLWLLGPWYLLRGRSCAQKQGAKFRRE